MPETESPDALAGAIGANTIVEIGCCNNTSELPPEATAFLNAVTALPREDRLSLLEIAADHYRAGQPIPPLMGLMDEARTWAAWASRGELKAYAAAIVERLSPADLAALIGWAGEVAA